MILMLCHFRYVFYLARHSSCLIRGPYPFTRKYNRKFFKHHLYFVSTKFGMHDPGVVLPFKFAFIKTQINHYDQIYSYYSYSAEWYQASCLISGHVFNSFKEQVSSKSKEEKNKFWLDTLVYKINDKISGICNRKYKLKKKTQQVKLIRKS